VFHFSILGGGASVGGLSPPKHPHGEGTGDNFCKFWSVVKLLLPSRGRQPLPEVSLWTKICLV